MLHVCHLTGDHTAVAGVIRPADLLLIVRRLTNMRVANHNIFKNIKNALKAATNGLETDCNFSRSSVRVAVSDAH